MENSMANHPVEMTGIARYRGEDTPPLELYESYANHPRYQDGPSPQDLGDEVEDFLAYKAYACLVESPESQRLMSLVPSRDQKHSHAASMCLMTALITQSSASIQGLSSTLSPIFGPRCRESALPYCEMVGLSQHHPAHHTLHSDDSLEAGIRQGHAIVTYTPAQIRVARHLAKLRREYDSRSPVVVIKQHGRKGEHAMRFTPYHGKGIDTCYPYLPRLQEEVIELAKALQPSLEALTNRVAKRWSSEPFGQQNADTHDFFRWLWLVADELQFSSLQFDEVSTLLHHSVRYFRQSRDLIVRI